MFLSELIDRNHPSVLKQVPKVVESVLQALAHASISGNTAQKVVISTRTLLGSIPHEEAVALLQKNPSDLDVVQKFLVKTSNIRIYTHTLIYIYT